MLVVMGRIQATLQRRDDFRQRTQHRFGFLDRPTLVISRRWLLAQFTQVKGNTSPTLS
jgi:hypothetical protein